MNFYISLENAKNRYISAAVQPTSTKYGMMIQNVSSAPSVKNFILKVQDGGRPIYCTIMRSQFNVDFQDGGCLSSFRIWKLKFLTAKHFRDTFCVITLNFVEVDRTVAKISHFCVFRKNLLNDQS